MTKLSKIPAGFLAAYNEDKLKRKREELKKKLLETKEMSSSNVSINEFGEIEQKSTIAEYADIKSAIQKVINRQIGFTIISIGDRYVQFALTLDNQLYFDAVSNMFQPEIGNKDDEFRNYVLILIEEVLMKRITLNIFL